MAADAVSEDQQERQSEERTEHRICRQSDAGYGQSLVWFTSGQRFSVKLLFPFVF